MDTVFSLTCAFDDAQDYAVAQQLIGTLGTVQLGKGARSQNGLCSEAPLVEGEEGFGQLHSQAPLVRDIALELHEPGYLELGIAPHWRLS